MLKALDHTAISVPDLDKALAFYVDLLGFEKLYEAGWPQGATAVDNVVGLKDSSSRVAMLQLGSAKIELFEYLTPTPDSQDPDRAVHHHGITHLCFEVDDIHAAYQKLLDAGVRFNCEPTDLGSGLFTYGRDPFGNVFELKG